MKPWKVKGWIIPEFQSAEFVAHMERVLGVYKRPYTARYPVVCMDESPKQLIKETRTPLPIKPGSEKKEDYEYERCGVSNVFMAVEPLQGKRCVKVTEFKTKKDWACFIKEICDIHYPDAKKIVLVMDNYTTHTVGAFYETYPPREAKRILDRLEFVFTPKHASWLNMAEIELHVLNGQCLNRRIDTIEEMKKEVMAWQNHRNNRVCKIDWRFDTDEARIKLKKLYPSIHS